MNRMKLFDGIEKISSDEYRMFQFLLGVESKTLWGIAINNVCNAPDACKFRQLICDLKSQAHDEPAIMQSILGQPAFTHLLTL